MNVGGVGSGAQSSAADNQKSIRDLELRKKQLNEELQKLQENKTMSSEEKQQKVETLNKQIQNIDVQIQAVNNKSNQGAAKVEPQSKEAGKIAMAREAMGVETGEKTETTTAKKIQDTRRKYDLYEGESGEAAEDNTYFATHEDGKLKVQFNNSNI